VVIELSILCDFCLETTTVLVGVDEKVIDVLAEQGFGTIDGDKMCCKHCNDHQDFYSFEDQKEGAC